jgi:hypothetical protein
MSEEKQYLPLGSIVILRKGAKKVAIYGRKQIHISTNVMYDYIACLYPEGYIDENYTYLFNHEDIDVVVHTGYSNYEETEFQHVLRSIQHQEPHLT